ncbi:MAG: TIGR04086 family membrane protein [Firmicutes bacterium]|nr:TIGR04086 family membrane protein [Bacillota bacterium]
MVKNEAGKEKEMKVVGSLLKGLAMGCVITVAVFIVLAVLLTYTDMKESVIPMLSVAVTAVSAMVAGFITAKGASSRGIFWGMGAGAIYALILFAVLIAASVDFTMSIGRVAGFVAAIAGGAIGGILGIGK